MGLPPWVRELLAGLREFCEIFWESGFHRPRMNPRERHARAARVALEINTVSENGSSPPSGHVLGLARGPKTRAAFWPRKRPRRNATHSLCPGCGTKTRSKKWHPKLGHYLASKLAPPSTLYVGGWLSCVWGCRCMGVRRANLCVSPVPVKAPRSCRKNPKNVEFCGPVLGARKWHRFWSRFI